MKVLTRYQATDGSEWDDIEKCQQRDALDAEIRALEERLGPRVLDGRQAVNTKTVAEVKAAVVAIAHRLWPKEAVFQKDAASIHPMSFAVRFLDDNGGPVRRIWNRFMCTNGDWEYDQPYFALNPDKFRG